MLQFEGFLQIILVQLLHYLWRHWRPGRWKDLPKFTQLENQQGRLLGRKEGNGKIGGREK